MKLISATVRNYRVHRDLTIYFDRARTLIGGPNESGKSTFIEAVHRALFLKATVTGEAQESMESTLFPGHPEVEVCFEAQGAGYRLAKRFSGQSGTARLTQTAGETWQGEEAESRLAELLGVEALGGGKGILDRVKRQWAHLWVWQGQSSDDACEHIARQQTGLLRQLQQVGGAVAMQSDLDGRVASRFSQTRAQIFAKTGAWSPLKSSDLHHAQEDLRQAEAVHMEAVERIDGLSQALRDFEEASATVERAVVDLEDIGRQIDTVRRGLAEIETLRGIEKERVLALGDADEKLAILEGAEKSIGDLRSSIDNLREALRPMEEECGHLEARSAGVRKERAEAERAYEEALEKTRGARLVRELAAAHLTGFQKKARCRELRERLKVVQGLERDLRDIREQIARLVSIDQDGLQALQNLENRHAQAVAALGAMAAEVEVVAAGEPVWLSDELLPAGESRTVSALAELRIGESTRLKIHPGGGDGLVRAREDVRTLRQRMQEALDGYGLRSVADAADMVVRRARLRSTEDATLAALKQWPGGQAELCETAEAEFAAAMADVERRVKQMDGVELPSTAAETGLWLEREEEALRLAESGETGLKAARDALGEQADTLAVELKKVGEVLTREKQKLAGFVAQLEMLMDNYGSDEVRAQRLREARHTRMGLEAEADNIRASLRALQPDLLEADWDRLQRALRETDQRRQDAEKRRAVSQAALRLDGMDDPCAALAQAEARLEAAARGREAAYRKARAIALVDDLFRQEQQILSDRFSRPLAEKIDGYLQCLFGPETRVVVSFENNIFNEVRLVRPGQSGATTFETLSEGAREQVAAAVRLAIAELLAADHDGSLPVVFDDAFAYSDPERVQTLQRMLERGARQGLQIIVLTCNPSDYAGLGARSTIIG